MTRIYVVGTADTKGAELAFLGERIAALGAEAVLVDIGIRTGTIPVDIDARTVASHHPGGIDAALGANDRGVAVAAMGEAFANFASGLDDADGVIGIGGGGGTSMVTAGMRRLRLGDKGGRPSRNGGFRRAGAGRFGHRFLSFRQDDNTGTLNPGVDRSPRAR